MKPYFLLLLIVIIFCSCSKDEISESEIPEWLEPRIEELENTEQHCWSCNITRYTYNDEFYYNIYCGYWSCMYCKFYNSEGTLVSELSEFDFNNFIANKQGEIIIWECAKSE